MPPNDNVLARQLAETITLVILLVMAVLLIADLIGAINVVG